MHIFSEHIQLGTKEASPEIRLLDIVSQIHSTNAWRSARKKMGDCRKIMGKEKNNGEMKKINITQFNGRGSANILGEDIDWHVHECQFTLTSKMRCGFIKT